MTLLSKGESVFSKDEHMISYHTKWPTLEIETQMQQSELDRFCYMLTHLNVYVRIINIERTGGKKRRRKMVSYISISI